MEYSNREAFFIAKNLIKEKQVRISDSEIYQLLIFANDFDSYSEIVLKFDETLKKPEEFFENFNKVLSGMPIQYVLHLASFLDFDFYVDERVLIPRPETEGLVLLTKSFLETNKIKPKTIADMCTGSGCIAISMKGFFDEARVIATDIHDRCLDVAKINSDKFNANIAFLKGDKTEPLIEADERIDVLVSNPPYVKNPDDIEEKVKKYEPYDAIYVDGGLIFYENVFKNYHKFMHPNKFIMSFEFNYDQKEELTSLIEKYFKEHIQYHFYKDIYNLDRYLIIAKGYPDGIFEEN